MALAFVIGAAVMAVGGLVEVFFGVNAEGKQLEDIAKPLTAEEAESDPDEEHTASDHEHTKSGEEHAEPASEHAESSEPAASSGRYRFGPGRQSSRIMGFSTSLPTQSLDKEVAAVRGALAEAGPMDRRRLARVVGSASWGPGMLREVLRYAVASGAIVRISRFVYGPVESRGAA